MNGALKLATGGKLELIANIDDQSISFAITSRTSVGLSRGTVALASASIALTLDAIALSSLTWLTRAEDWGGQGSFPAQSGFGF
jgi:hypothetical protein